MPLWRTCSHSPSAVWAAAGMACIGCWLFTLRCSAVFYRGVEAVATCCDMLLVIMLSATVGAFLARRTTIGDAQLARAAIACGGSGFAGSLLCCVPSFAGLPSLPAVVIVGALMGVALIGSAFLVAAVCRAFGPRGFLRVGSISAGVAFAVFLALHATVPPDAAPVVFGCMMPLGCFLVHRGMVARQGDRPSPAGMASQSGQSVRCLVQAERAGAVDLATSKTKLCLLAASAGFFATCSTAMWPKTAHLPHQGMSSVYIGTVNLYCLVYVLLFVLLLAAFALFVSRRPQVSSVALTVAGVCAFACVFLVLPSMKETPLVFVLINALSLAVAAASVPVSVCYLEAVHSVSTGSSGPGGPGGPAGKQGTDEKPLFSLALWYGLGGLLAAAIARILLGPLFGVLPFQDGLFVLLAALGCLACVIAALLCADIVTRVFWPSLEGCAGGGNAVAGQHAGAGTGGAGTVAVDAAGTAARVGAGARMGSGAGTGPGAGAGSDDRAARCDNIAFLYGLTPREREVLALLAEGRNEPYIEKALCVSRATVKTHVNHIYKKTGVTSRQKLLDLIAGK